MNDRSTLRQPNAEDAEMKPWYPVFGTGRNPHQPYTGYVRPVVTDQFSSAQMSGLAQKTDSAML